ncbi:MAG: ABC transporter ATP-binding protein [Halobacteriales archaeon]|nr:ABC transporter ATP-binding protein [Halobacteriales archaeon]
MSGAVVRAERLSKRFGGAAVLDRIDLACDPGEVTLLMGPNGDGKSVLLACLAGGLSPTDGRALVGGRRAEVAGERVSLLLQGSVGLPGLTARENARFYAALHPASAGRWPALLDRFDVAERDRALRHCSGGTRRKVELAVALDPDVPAYLLDEPTAALDLGAVHELHRVIAERRDAGHTVVLTSHAPLDAELADRLVFLRSGRVAADGAPDALLGALPPVVRLRGAVHAARERVADHLRAGHAYGSGAELRGFLRPSRSLRDVRSAVGDLGVTVEADEPTAVDLFEHLASVEPG